MNQFKALLQTIQNEHLFIQTHNYPDPDALASARGLQVLLKHHGIASTICYKGHIDKFNTLEMLELLHIEIYPGSRLDMNNEDEIILVDCQKGNNNVKDFNGSEIACIDHHKMQKTDYYRHYDIRSNVGACSTIISSYFLENQIPIDPEMATTLLYGIKMDTANLTRQASDMDVDMFGYLYKLARRDIISQLDSNSLKLSDLNSYAKAIADLRIHDMVGFANIGKDCSEAIIGTLGDFLLTVIEVHMTMVYSYRAGGLKFSLRSDTPQFDCAQMIKAALEGYGDGGGHATMAAGFIPQIPTEKEALAIASIIEDRITGLASNKMDYTFHLSFQG